MLSITCTIKGISPYSQSRKHDAEKLKDEGYDAYDIRTWKEHCHTNGDGESIVIPGHAIHQMLVVGARKGRLKPKAAASAREGLAGRLETGIALLDDAKTDMKLSEAVLVPINAHSNGDRKDRQRVTRRYPVWSPGWTATFTTLLLDESLRKEDLEDALKWGGLVCGLGRFRPECLGTNGRFVTTTIKSADLAIDDLAREPA